ncbi:MAG: ion transporter [Candidatus Altiarchaeota archaeon]|nr:ion transporter [Candidatus Altiarchaeota archaeon]
MEADHQKVSKTELVWELIIIFAAVISIAFLIVEYGFGEHVSEAVLEEIEEIDMWLLGLFVLDVGGRHVFSKGDKLSLAYNVSFVKHNWLDILAISPFLRFLRVFRFARLFRLTKVAKVSEIAKVSKITKAGKVAKVGETAKLANIAGSAGGLEAAKALEAGDIVKKTEKTVTGVSHGKHVKHEVDYRKKK